MHELNFHCRWRIEFAKQISEKISKIQGVRAIVIGGSVARGYADEYADLEIPIFWDKSPNEDIRKFIVSELNASYLYPYNYDAMEDNLLINEFQVDLWHCTVPHEESVIDSIIKDFDTDLGSSNFMDTIRACIPLHGDQLINSWKNKAQLYPRQLAINNIEKSLQSIKSGQVELYVKRQNPTMVCEHIIELQKQLFVILLALNNEYFPSFKWLYKSLENIRIKPEGIEQRFRDIFNYSTNKSVENIIKIIYEVIDLINKIYPEINTEIVYNNLKPTRKKHYYPVSLL